jgi:hypothetical protein
MNISIALFALLVSTNIFAQKKKIDFLIKKESQLMVHGDASIINFTCHLKSAFDMTPFPLRGVQREGMNFLDEGKILVPLKNLDCGESGRNKDMLEMLKAKDFPNIILDFKELGVSDWKKNLQTGHQTSEIYSKIEITIGGVAVTYPVHLSLVKIDENNILASGRKILKVTDFNIQPKTYLLGLVKIKELVEIDFELVLTK